MAALRAILLIALAALVLDRAHATQFDVFLQITPAQGNPPPGDSADAIYSDWIEVLGFEAGSNNPATFGSTGGGATKANFQEFTLVKKAGAPSSRLFKYLTSGQLITTMKMVIAVRGPIRTEMWKMTATTCFFTRQSFSATTGEADVEERLTFAAGKIEWSYTQISASGDALSELFANWSVINNTGGSGTRAPSSTGGVDSDGDGIPDDWEVYYGLHPHIADADADYDGDGLTALEEYIAHTDPNRAESTFKVTGLQPGGAGLLTLSWQSVVGLNYRILSAPDPDGPYTLVRNVTSAGTGTTSATVSTAGGRTFYKVVTP